MPKSLSKNAISKKKAKQDFEALTVILSVALVVSIVSIASNLVALLPKAGTTHSGLSVAMNYPMPTYLRNRINSKGKVSGPKQAFSQAFQEPQSERERQVAERFQQAIGLLHARRYEYAITALDTVLEMAPELPEAYVNMGYAFIGLKEYGPARGAFEKAIELKVDQVNAYYGLAISFEGQEQYEAALGSMRTYIHLSEPNDAYLAKARSAIWEWEAQLGRVKGVKPAPEGTDGATIKATDWGEGH